MTLKNILKSCSLIFLMGCSSQLTSYLNSDASFQEFNTYLTVNTDQILYGDIIQESIIQEMDRREYQKSSIEPDLKVHYITGSSTTTNIDQTSNPFNIYQTIPTSRNTHEAFLIITMLDSRDKLVWQASLPLRKPKKKETQEEVIKQIVSNIFNDYTYRSGSKIPDPTLVK